jgi:coenzyme F420 hydrogenase subunit beta
MGCIKMSIGSKGIFEPVVDMTRCSDCGLCMEVCSGHGVHYDEMTRSVLGEDASSRYLGRYVKLLIASSTRKDLHDQASSGGMVTETLLYLLRSGSIQGALVARCNQDDPCRVDSVMARDEASIIAAMGSKYYPTCINERLKDIINDDTGARYAYVGLPCQIASLRKAEKILPELMEKIYLRISLFCGRMVSRYGLINILRRFCMDIQTISYLHYRYGKWPGKMLIRGNGSTRQINYHEYYLYFMYDFFTPYRCLVCNDFHGDLSEICFGDAWLNEYRGSGVGRNLVIARTRKSADLLDEMNYVGLMECEKVTEDEFVKTFGNKAYLRKKDSLLSRMNKYKNMRLAVPEIVDRSLSFSHNDRRDIFYYLHSRYLNTHGSAKMIAKLPSALIKIYYSFLNQLA